LITSQLIQPPHLPKDEIAKPLGADIHIGTPEECDPRVSFLIQGYPIKPTRNKFYKRVLLNPPARPQDTWSIAWRRADLGNGRSIALAQSVLACGGANGVSLMSESGWERVLEVQADGLDLVLELPLRWGIGYCLR
jgi:hypothetical protein